MRINVPIFDTKIDDAVVSNVISEYDQDDIEKLIRAFNRFPTFVFLGLTIGYTF